MEGKISGKHSKITQRPPSQGPQQTLYQARTTRPKINTYSITQMQELKDSVTIGLHFTVLLVYII
jgi:hypothetical protein